MKFTLNHRGEMLMRTTGTDLDSCPIHCNSILNDFTRLSESGVIKDLIFDLYNCQDLEKNNIEQIIYNLKTVIVNMSVNKLKIIAPSGNCANSYIWQEIRKSIKPYERQVVEIPRKYLGYDDYNIIDSFKLLMEQQSTNENLIKHPNLVGLLLDEK